MKLFAVLDVKANFFMSPFADRDTVSALRGFEIGANDPKSTFNRFPDDFALCELGSFDSDTGRIELHSSPLNLATARVLIKQRPVLSSVDNGAPMLGDRL